MALEDLRGHSSSFDAPIKVTYRGLEVWEMPPNGQGLTALLALNILEGFDFTGEEWVRGGWQVVAPAALLPPPSLLRCGAQQPRVPAPADGGSPAQLC